MQRERETERESSKKKGKLDESLVMERIGILN